MSKVGCPTCQKLLNVPDEYIGKKIKCPSCKNSFTAYPEVEQFLCDEKPIETQREKDKKKTFILLFLFLFFAVGAAIVLPAFNRAVSYGLGFIAFMLFQILFLRWVFMVYTAVNLLKDIKYELKQLNSRRERI